MQIIYLLTLQANYINNFFKSISPNVIVYSTIVLFLI